MEEVSMEEVKKKYIESIERRMKEILFMDSLEKLQRKQETKGCWLKKGDVKKETESTIVPVQDQAYVQGI